MPVPEHPESPAPPTGAPAEHDEILLEPTNPFGSSPEETDAGETPPLLDAWQHASGEATMQLRSRLAAASGFLAVAFLVMMAFSLASYDSIYGLAAGSLAIRAVLAALVCGLMLSGAPLSFLQLRCVEYLFFALEMLVYVWGQHSMLSTLMLQGDWDSVALIEKNGIFRVAVVMLVYGVFIPNDPRTTARVVMTMALCPIAVLAAVLHQASVAQVADSGIAGAEGTALNALFVLIAAALAIFASFTLNGLRRELHDVRQLGQYRLLDKLGEGGMGAVYLAEHQLLKRPCALKLINADLEENEIAVARFEREVQSAASLSHPNTIEVYDYGRADDGTFYYVMEYLAGLSIADLVRQEGELPAGRTVYLARQVCGALAEAHRMGLVHRDLKPANIFVAILGGQCDVAKVLDFGLVKQENPQDGKQLTADYTVSGTPQFMSPEQARGERNIDGRADLYAVGAILYYMLTGRPPFERESAMSLMIAHASEPVRPPTQLNSRIPQDLEAVILKCLAKAPADRYEDAKVLATALEQCRCASEWSQSQAEAWWLQRAAQESAAAEGAAVPQP
ncbi:MAG: serine/threonine-protein kinase [Planctomycetales bacterium]